MKMPNFSKMTVDALMSARVAIDQLLNKRLPGARKELQKRLNALNNFVGGESQGRARSSKAKVDGRSKLKGRRVPPKYRGPNGETWSGRGMTPRWLSAEIKGGANLEDFAIASGRGRKSRKKLKKAASKRGKRAASKRPTAKRKSAKPAKAKPAKVNRPAAAPPAEPVENSG